MRYLNLAGEMFVCKHSVAVVSNIEKCLQHSMKGCASVPIDGSPQAGFRVWGLVGGYAHIWMVSKAKNSQAAPVLCRCYKLHMKHM